MNEQALILDFIFNVLESYKEKKMKTEEYQELMRELDSIADQIKALCENKPECRELLNQFSDKLILLNELLETAAIEEFVKRFLAIFQQH